MFCIVLFWFGLISLYTVLCYSLLSSEKTLNFESAFEQMALKSKETLRKYRHIILSLFDLLSHYCFSLNGHEQPEVRSAMYICTCSVVCCQLVINLLFWKFCDEFFWKEHVIISNIFKWF